LVKSQKEVTSKLITIHLKKRCSGNLAPFFGELSQIEKHSEIKPPLFVIKLFIGMTQPSEKYFYLSLYVSMQ
jgi:hypothetical protein